MWKADGGAARNGEWRRLRRKSGHVDAKSRARGGAEGWTSRKRADWTVRQNEKKKGQKVTVLTSIEPSGTYPVHRVIVWHETASSVSDSSTSIASIKGAVLAGAWSVKVPIASKGATKAE